MDVRRRITSFEEYKEEYQKSVDNPEAFWAGHADSFVWKKKWDKVLDWNFSGPDVKWFEGGELNITENCLDRHLEERGDKYEEINIINCNNFHCNDKYSIFC